MDRDVPLLDSGESLDRISNLPRPLIDLILERMPLHLMARTSILSKTWRNIWVTQPHLVFDGVFFNQVIPKNFFMKDKQIQLYEVSSIISSILFFHTGPILKFHLSIPRYLCDLHQYMIFWIRNISNNGVKRLKLYNKYYVAYKMPSCFFSCLWLTHLSLTKCILNPPLRFGGFCNLITVKLVDVIITGDMSFGTRLDKLKLIRCTGIEHLGCQFKYNNNITELRIDGSREIDWGWFECAQKLQTLELKEVKNSRDNIISLDKLFGNMPKIIDLDLDGLFFKFLEPGAPISKKLFTTMEKLIFLWIDVFEIYDLVQIQYVLCLIRSSSPNLEYLYIDTDSKGKSRDCLDTTVSLVEEYLELQNFTDMILCKLKTVTIWDFVGSRAELHFIKLLLATSPSLRWIELKFMFKADPKEELKIARELMRFPRASSAAQLIWT